MRRFRDRVRSSRRYRWWTLGVVLSGFFSAGISITILSAVLPTIASGFDVGTHTIAWVVTGPMLVHGVLMPTMGKAGDLYGRKRVYLLGWGVAAAFAGAAAISWSAGALIAFRVAGAAAGAATGPVSMAILLSVFEPHDRVRAMAWWSFVSAGAPVLGLVVGGPLVDLIGWRWIFGIQAPLAVPALVLGWLVLREDAPSVRPRFDVRGSALLGCAMAALLWGLNRGGALGWTRADVIAGLAAAPPLLAAFVLAERRHPDPLVSIAYFRRRNVTVPIAVQLLSHMPYMGCFFISPFLLQSVLGYDNARTSWALLPRPLANALLSASAGVVAVRLGERFCAATGMGIMGAGMVWLAGVGPQSDFAMVAAGMALTGAGLGLSYPGLVSSVANAVAERDFGTMSATQNLAQTVGMVIGIQGFQTLQAVRAVAVGEVEAYRQTFLAGAVFASVAFALALAVRSMHRPARASALVPAALGDRGGAAGPPLEHPPSSSVPADAVDPARGVVHD